MGKEGKYGKVRNWRKEKKSKSGEERKFLSSLCGMLVHNHILTT
jgi:hypothetical protein